MNANVGMTGHRSGGSSRSWWAQAFQNRLIALVLVMIVAVPLLAAPADYSLTGVAALTLETLSVLLLTVLLWRARWDFRPEQVRTFLKTSANVPILLLLGWVTLSCVLSPYKIFSIQALLQAGAGALLYFAVAYQFRQSKHLSMLGDVLLFLSLAVALGGLAQYQLVPTERARAIFGDAQALGSFVTLMLPIVAALAFVDTKPRRQTIAQVTFVLMVGALLLTQGRSAWIGSVVGLSVLAALAARIGQVQIGGTKGGMPLKARKHLMVLPAVIALIAVGFTVLVNGQNQAVFSRVSTVTSLGTDVSWQSRVQEHWKGSVEMIAERPVLGWGAGLYPVYQLPFTGQGHAISPKGTVQRVSIAEQAHNYYLQTAVELGLPGLVLTLAVLGGFWASAWKRLPQMDAGIRRTLLMASVAATAGFAIDALSSPSWQYAQTAMFVWLALGMGTSCVRPRLRREEREEEVAVVSPVRSRAIGFATRSAVLATSLGLATLLPTAYSAAQTFDYGSPQLPGGKDGDLSGGVPPQPLPGPGAVNPGGNSGGVDNNSGRDIAIGTAAVTAVGYAIYSLLGSSSGSAGGAGSGTLVPVADATPTPTPTAVVSP